MLIFLSVRFHSDDFLGIRGTQVAKFHGFFTAPWLARNLLFPGRRERIADFHLERKTTMSAPHKRAGITGVSLGVTEATIWNLKKCFGFVAGSNAIMAARRARASP
jgi:hypothetical protein